MRDVVGGEGGEGEGRKPKCNLLNATDRLISNLIR